MILEFKIHEGMTAVPHGKITKAEMAKVPDAQVIHVEYKKESKGSQSMLSTWWWWMTQTAEFMAAHGVTMPLMIDKDGKFIGSRPFEKEDAHALFTEKWMGSIEGKRLSWSRDKKRPELTIADTGQRHHALSQHDAYCTDRGIPITIPIKSEYRELLERMNS